MTAPLNGAVVANAVVKVEGNRKSVQHLDGGIVKELRVKEGDRVAADDVLIVLDDTQARAEHDVLSQQYLVLRATEERLKTELARQPELVMPEDFKARADDPNLPGIWRGQLHQFESRLAALAGQRNVIKEKIAQLEAQITGGRGAGQGLSGTAHIGATGAGKHRAAGQARLDRAAALSCSSSGAGAGLGGTSRRYDGQYRQGAAGDRRADAANGAARQ